ncbi:lambda exonuclease family protein [Cellulosimicrobium cellulans]|uniref:lambda exonuclease family protein n=1 Tax=Cellulosimicrobium cellulans TaxID=1710 RepID=UPI003C691DC5
MSLTVLHDLVQGTDEWHAARRGIITASVIGQLITPSTLKPANNPVARSVTATLVAERITGFTEPTPMTADMFRGVEDEPRAREKYAEHHAPVDEAGFMILERDGFKLGYSPDGLVGTDGLIEIKSRRAKKHLQTILADQVPTENMAQLQAGLFVSGRQWIDYVSYCGGMPLWVKRVHPDPMWFQAIPAVVHQFEKQAFLMTSAYNRAVHGLPMTERVLEEEMVI